jgi:hypothetical protein
MNIADGAVLYFTSSCLFVVEKFSMLLPAAFTGSAWTTVLSHQMGEDRDAGYERP